MLEGNKREGRKKEFIERRKGNREEEGKGRGQREIREKRETEGEEIRRDTAGEERRKRDRGEEIRKRERGEHS